MPELPEVETVARQLATTILGQRIKAVKVLDKKLRLRATPLVGSRVRKVYRQGKQVVLELIPKQTHVLFLVFHLRMTGRLTYSESVPERSLRLILQLDRGFLCFVDVRRFGTATIFKSARDLLPKGADPLFISESRFAALVDGLSQSLKSFLMRQDKLVGIGNIYASEILYIAGLHPERIVGSLSSDEIKRLWSSTRKVLGAAIKHCGTTFSDFQDSNGDIGKYQYYLRVYKRENQKCKRCSSTIIRIVQQQRSTFFCPGCQPIDHHESN